MIAASTICSEADPTMITASAICNEADPNIYNPQ
jgi:hypothetical protein